MNFTKIIPKWKATGTEPPDSLKNSGFEAGYKPPADYFNWFMNGTSEVLEEIESLLESHKHVARDIDSGELPIERGGTGASTASGAKTNLGLDKVPNVSTNDQTPTYTEASSIGSLTSGEKLSVAMGKIAKAISSLISHLSNTSNPHGVTAEQVGASATGHKHSASDVTSGTLPINRGGTGQTTAAGIRNALGLGNTTGALPIANGGTGATTRADAIKNLLSLGSNPVVSADTPTAWNAFGNCSAYFNGSSTIINKPTDIGIMVQNTYSTAVLQIWYDLYDETSGRIYVRKGNGTGWDGKTSVAAADAWVEMLDENSVIPVANGGTGATTVAGARKALGLGNTSGAVPVANGGTGATTVAGARNALGLGNTSGAVPVANGGTGATTAAAARTNLGLTGAETKKLLWTNAKPTSDFATQTVSLTLSGYDAVEIEYYASTSKAVLDVTKKKIGESSMLTGYLNPQSTNGYINLLSRLFDVTTSGITFKAGFAKRTSDSSTVATNNSYCIPYKIYGIKGV